jgi:hypothetical protein
MPDSTIFIKYVYIDTANLELINQKLSALQNTIPKVSINPSISIWVPLLASIIGGLLVWAGQAIESTRKRKIERTSNLLEIYAYCRKLEAVMKNNYRELAMAKSHVEYWWHVANSSSSSVSQKQQGYDEHLRSQAYAREIERKIGDTKAEFIGHVRKFQALKSIKRNVETSIETISDLTNAKAKSYDSTIPHEKLRFEMYDQDEKELRDTYYRNLVPFKEINDAMQLTLNTKN